MEDLWRSEVGWETGYWRAIHYCNSVTVTQPIFKRGIKGVYQHCGEQHLQRYLAEFDFRYSHRSKLGNDDAARADVALKSIEGKRLTYRRIDEAEVAQAVLQTIRQVARRQVKYRPRS